MTRPQVQRVGAYVVCVDADTRLLLCRLTAITGRPGWWTLPGGGLAFGEHPEAAALRELQEETGYTGRITELLSVHSVIGAVVDADGMETDSHRIRVLYRAEITGGSLRPERDGTSDLAQWCTREEALARPLVELGRLGAALAWPR